METEKAENIGFHFPILRHYPSCKLSPVSGPPQKSPVTAGSSNTVPDSPLRSYVHLLSVRALLSEARDFGNFGTEFLAHLGCHFSFDRGGCLQSVFGTHGNP